MTKKIANASMPTMNKKHPFKDYDTEQALELATTLKYGPLHVGHKVVPTVDEAIKILMECNTMKSCNWITGQTAVQCLKASRGDKVEWT